MNSRVLRFLLVVFISGVVGYYVGIAKISFEWNKYQPKVHIVSKEPPPAVMNLDLSLFWVVLEKLQNQYYDKNALDSQKLVNGAIEGMVESLGDPYTMYLPPKQNDDFKQGLAGKFEGIGAELGMKGKQIIVVSPLDGSPALKAGIKPEDAIIKVDDQSTFGWTLSQTVDKIRGPKGSQVSLQIVHKDAQTPNEVTITRDTITVKSVVMWTKKVKDVENINVKGALKDFTDKKIAYIRLSQFGDNTNQEWLSLTNKLSFEANGDPAVSGVVLDLRNNPGGYLTDAVFIASEFIKDGVIVMQEDGRQNRIDMSVSRKGLLLDTPLIVLINKGSASASEIVAGALRDHKRAKLVGELSFGKGTIQQAEDLGAGAGIHVTIAKWLTPNGTWVHMKGLTPDITVPLDQKDAARDTQLEKAIEELVK